MLSRLGPLYVEAQVGSVNLSFGATSERLSVLCRAWKGQIGSTLVGNPTETIVHVCRLLARLNNLCFRRRAALKVSLKLTSARVVCRSFLPLLIAIGECCWHVGLLPSQVRDTFWLDLARGAVKHCLGHLCEQPQQQ